ncbi:MAG: pilus assembly protein TadG-related protein, partial [Anaerolineae bacterium]
MKTTESPTQRGQTLVVVALSMMVLMLMAGLAVDVGMAYTDRRDMQNAADAAALAGAQKWCDGDGDQAATTAQFVAINLNGADPDPNLTKVTSANFTVNVVAGTKSQTFFFRLVGIDEVPVRAEAAAICGCADAVGGAWPVLFDQLSWDKLGICEDASDDMEVNLMVWDSKKDAKSITWPEGENWCLTWDCTVAKARPENKVPATFDLNDVGA